MFRRAHRTSRRPAAVTILAGAALLAAAAVGPVGAQSSDDRVVIRIGLHAAEKNLNPFITPRALPVTHDFTMLVYDTLFWSQARLEPEPWLAESAEPSEDLRTWTVTLRDGLTWHDGQPLTAEDVAFTFRLFAEDGGPGRYGHHVYDHPVFQAAEVLDARRVALRFQDPIATFELVPGGDLPILPRHKWDGVEDLRADATTPPVGSGPFKMVEYVPDQSYRLVANDDYFLGKPLVDEIVMPVVRDASAAFAGLRTGELDFVTRTLPSQLVDQMRNSDRLEVIEGTRLIGLWLGFNTRRPPLTDPLLRKAISLAINNQAIVDVVDGGRGRPGNDTWTHPDSPWAHPEGGHEFDPAKANAMLDGAGYARAGSGQTRSAPDGTPLRFTILANSFAPPHVRAAQLVAEQAAAIGVDLEVEPLDDAAISDRRRPGGPGQPPDFELFVSVLESHGHADPDHLFFFFHSPGRGVGAVFTGFSNAAFDQALEASLPLPVDDKKELIHRAQEIFAAEAPAVVLSYPDGIWAYNPSAYNGWISDTGHGAFTKRSFLADYARTGGEGGQARGVVTDDGSSAAGWLAGGGAVLLAAALGAALVWRRRRSQPSVEE